MSAFSGDLIRGGIVYHKEVEKTVKNWYFIGDPDGVPNSDIIVIEFTDGSNTGKEGFTHIRYKKTVLDIVEVLSNSIDNFNPKNVLIFGTKEYSLVNVGKKIYNIAIEEAANNAKTRSMLKEPWRNTHSECLIVDREAILDLKIK